MLRLKSLLIVGLFIPNALFSATQGTLGTTSTGSVVVTITVPSLVSISGLTDITMAPTSLGTATGNTTACIYSNLTGGNYFVTATSTNAAAGQFRAIASGGATIAYSAYWNNAAAASQTTTLVSGTKTAVQTGASTTSLTCGGTANANFNISLSAAQAAGVVQGTYTDTATLLITPT